MEKHDIFAQIHQLEERIGVVYTDITDLKQQVISLIEENQRLTMENRQLRNLMKQEETEELSTDHTPKSTTSTIGEGHDNLARLYQEGFHICNVYYGHLRTEGDCLFCLSFLKK